ncbi:MAG: hexose kinase [Anaerolineae bacterium]|nr:hexose kinase [Anaerolineae bacterium]
MLLCVTPNPALDRTLTLADFSLGGIFRPTAVLNAAGGKGVNTARAARVLGVDSLCMGPLGGYTGRFVAELAEREGLHGAWTWVDKLTRICTIIVNASNYEVTSVYEQMDALNLDEWQRVQHDIEAHIHQAESVCISSSVPKGVTPTAFADFVAALVASGKPVWVDTSGAPLAAAMNVPNVNIKINDEEAAEALGQAIHDPDQAISAAQSLSQRTGGAVVITLGGRGAVMASAGEGWQSTPPKIEVKSTVGSGDSFLAGLMIGLRESAENALRLAIATGAANAMSIGGGQFSRADVDALAAKTHVTRRA